MLALATHQQTLRDAETMLLVNDREAEVLVLDRILKQSMRADDDRQRSVLQPAQQFRSFPAFTEPVSNATGTGNSRDNVR